MRFWAILAAVLAPLGSVAAEEPPPEWLFQAHPDAIAYADQACDSFQVFARKQGEKQPVWVGQMDPQNCRDFLLLRDPAMVKRLTMYWNESFESCVEKGPSDANRSTRVAMCREKIEAMDPGNPSQGFLSVFFIPAWACAIDAQRRDPELDTGVCMLIEQPDTDRKAWESLVGAAYLGININMHGDFGSCDDPAETRPLLPFTKAALPLAPRGVPVREIEARLSALGFACAAEPAAGKVAGVPDDARRCELQLFGHRWWKVPEASGQFEGFSFGDELRITLDPGEDGRNLGTCTQVHSTGP